MMMDDKSVGGNKHRFILRLSLAAMFLALSFVLTSFAIIPYPVGGYFNFGDVIDILSALILGPLGILVSALAGVFSDLMSGYALYAPFSLIAKGLLALGSWLLFYLLRKKKALRFTGIFLGAALEVLVYMLAYAILIGKGVYLASAFDVVQAFGSAILAVPLYLILEKKVLPRFNFLTEEKAEK